MVGRAFGDGGSRVTELVDALRDSTDGIRDLSLVATERAAVVGYVALTRSLLDAPCQLVQVLVLSPLAVAPPQQRRGVGAALVGHALRRAAAAGEPLVFLEGSPTYYRRFGFVAGGDLEFRRPSLRIPPPAFQVLRLPAHRPWMTGTLVYSRVFWDLDCVGLRELTA